MKDILLCREDFSDFAPGEFPYDPDHSAMGEYQYVTNPGYAGRWLDQVCNYTWNGDGPTWLVTACDGRHAMECMRVQKGKPHRIFPTLETGSPYWRDYAVEVSVRRLSLRGTAGLVFCLNHSIDTLVFALEAGGEAALCYRHKEELIQLARAPFEQNPDVYYRLRVDCEGELASCYVDGELILQARTPVCARGGKVGITADCPARFADFRVYAAEQEARASAQREADHAAREADEQRRHCPMRLLRRIDLKNFGTSRQVRFGHLLGDGSWQVVLAQMQRRVSRDAYGFISCLTAIDMDGNVLWQLGEPSADADRLGKVSADMPLQLYDIDGDGCDEVICGMDFEIRILDGRTGRVKRSVKTPKADMDDAGLIGVPFGEYAFARLNPDGIRICNFRGLAAPRDILIKDRYCRVWALDSELNTLWSYKSPTNTGHCPLPVDIDGDGRDEVLVGYRLLDSDGRELWSYPITEDHTDEIVAGRFSPDDGVGRFACVSGTQGFFIGDFYGNILRRDFIGHAQRVSVANYCPERPGLELAVTNFWGHQGCIFLYDCNGEQLWELQNGMNGNTIAPVNWDGDGSELILTNADPKRGGLLNGDGVRAVVFPDDGHPVLCCESIDLTGDGRDELVVWDYHSMWIYTPDGAPRGERYSPVQTPAYNASNYRGEYSYPDSSYMEFHADGNRLRKHRAQSE